MFVGKQYNCVIMSASGMYKYICMHVSSHAWGIACVCMYICMFIYRKTCMTMYAWMYVCMYMKSYDVSEVWLKFASELRSQDLFY